jgi:hypothetical protein
VIATGFCTEGSDVDANDETQGTKRFSRRKFVGLGIAGLGLAFLPGCVPLVAQQAPRSVAQQNDPGLYRGHKIAVTWRNGHPQLSIDGKPIVVVDTNGTYRAAGYAFDWASTPQGLAKKIIDYRTALASGR